MIRSFADREAKSIFERSHSRRYAGLDRIILKKLRSIHRSTILADLANPPGNKLEALRGDRAGQHSIRINDQWRICFIWRENNAYEVEIVDYH